MSKEVATIRIVDIAKMAGVSVGTVDRVIHKRGRVSEENEKKVNAILDIVDYQPNMIARSLASKKQFHIVAITPSFEKGEYWEAMSNGIDKAESEFKRYNVHIRKLFFDQYDNESFNKATDQLFDEEIDAVLIATLFTDSVIKLSRELNSRKIPYVYIDSNIPGEKQLAYIGTYSYDSGSIAAKILTEKISKTSDILVAKILHEGGNDSNQVHNRRKGFRDYLDEEHFEGKLHFVKLKIDDSVHNFSALDAIFQHNPHIKAAIIFNSTCYILGNYLKARNLRNINLVGYDLIEKNTKLLAEGTITTLIAQRPESQGYRGIKILSNFLIFNLLPDKINLMPIDILIKENIKYYLDYRFI